MQFTKEELYLIVGACHVTAATLQASKSGNPQAFLDLAFKANELILAAEKPVALPAERICGVCGLRGMVRVFDRDDCPGLAGCLKVEQQLEPRF